MYVVARWQIYEPLAFLSKRYMVLRPEPDLSVTTQHFDHFGNVVTLSFDSDRNNISF